MRRWIVPFILSLSVLGAQVSFAQIADGDKAARGKDWQGALKAYETANQSSPSADALEGVANAHYQLKNDGQAYAAYTDWLAKYGDKAPAAKKTQAQARLKELEGRTGPLTIDVNEKDAIVTVDDMNVGKSPLAAPVRLAPGPHRVRVTKEGFITFDGAPVVVAGAPSSVTVKLEAAATKGKVVVREKTGKPIRVIVDGTDMGDAPWTGEVEAGAHDVAGRSPTMAATPQKITVERGKEIAVELVASSTTAPLKVTTNDGKGLIYIDDKLVGEGQFSGEIPAGAHRIRVTREGYDPYEEDVVLEDKKPVARSVALKLSSKIETGPVQKANRPLEGLYGGFQFLGSLLPSGMGTSTEKLCEAGDRPAAVLPECDGGSALGGGFGGFFGHHWDPVGVELFMMAQYDQLTSNLGWLNSSPDGGIGPDPARKEEYSYRRVGGLGAARVRYTIQGEKLRFSAAAGVGLSTRTIFLERHTVSSSDPALQDKLVTDGQGYLSFALNIEPTIQYRITEGVAAMLGFSLTLDNPTSLDDVPRSKAEGGHRLGAAGVTTPAYDLTSGTQVWTGLFVGMMFGP